MMNEVVAASAAPPPPVVAAAAADAQAVPARERAGASARDSGVGPGDSRGARQAAPGDRPLDRNRSSEIEAQDRGRREQSLDRRAFRDLSPEEQRVVRELQAREQEVIAHERAHKAAGGRYAGGVSYETQQGPDGRAYKVGGEVSIDTSPENDAQATIDKMQVVIRAALAPPDPSAQDQAVAAQARSAMTQARQQLAEEKALAREAGVSEEEAEEMSGTELRRAADDEEAAEREARDGARAYGMAAAQGDPAGEPGLRLSA